MTVNRAFTTATVMTDAEYVVWVSDCLEMAIDHGQEPWETDGRYKSRIKRTD